VAAPAAVVTGQQPDAAPSQVPLLALERTGGPVVSRQLRPASDLRNDKRDGCPNQRKEEQERRGIVRIHAWLWSVPGAGNSSSSLRLALHHSTTASASISTSISGEISLLISIMLVAGRISAKNCPCARPIRSHSAMFVTKMRARTTSFKLAPTFTCAASMFRIVFSVSAPASPAP